MREAVSFGQSPCLFLVYGPGFQVPVSVSVYCVLSGTVFCSDVWGFVWSGCCALVDAVACICTCCCGCARCIRLWSCHLYLVLFISLLSAVCILVCASACVQHYILSCILVPVRCPVWSAPCLLSSLRTLTSAPCRLICNPMYSIYKPNTIGIR